MIDPMTLALDFQQWKIVMVDATGLAKDALHIHIGLAAFIVTRLVWRRRGGWWFAWTVALCFALGGEWLDMRAEGKAGTPQPDATHWHDIWNTMLWPTVLLIVGRWLQPRSRDIEAARREGPPDAPASGQDGQ